MIRSHRLLTTLAFTFTFILIPSLFIVFREKGTSDYYKGVDASRAEDYKTAAKYYSLAAKKGHSSAQYNLGLLYEEGKGIEKNMEEASKWYRRSAEQGNPLSMHSFALICYAGGEGSEQDKKEAFNWWKKSVETFQKDKEKDRLKQEYFGHWIEYGEAMFYLGVCYSNGFGVKKDAEEAVKWWRKAAEQRPGHPMAMFRLGLAYANGEGVEKDLDEAVQWWRKAAEAGNASAMFQLGECYANGVGVEKNNDKAVKWYSKSAEQGDEAAKEALKKLEK